MRFASSITSTTDPVRAVAELVEPLGARVTPGMVDLALLFITSHYVDELSDVLEGIQTAFSGAVMLGCTAEGTIGRNCEIERTPSMSLLVGSLPDVDIRPFRMRQRDLDSIHAPPDWERVVGVAPESGPTFIGLADPFRLAVHELVEQLNDGYPGAPLVGGIASAGSMPKQNRLFVEDDVQEEGLVGVALSGGLTVDTVVSQGCRPIGKPFVITRGERNVVKELGGKPALEQLHSVLVGLSPDEERLARQSLFMGRVIDEYRDRFARGDFLIHNIIGVDRKSGAMAIAGHARVGSTVQFHVRDAASADEDLRAMLAPHAATGVRGAMLFGCNGRGTRMWPQPGHDAGVVQELLGDVPLAGFFCGGEFGRVGSKNFIHGFTASIALFRPVSTGVPTAREDGMGYQL